MDEIRELLKNWEDNNFVNPDALKAAHQAITILLEKVELLEKQIADLQSLQEG
jgi:DNA-binding transcriptional MerR regulator